MTAYWVRVGDDEEIEVGVEETGGVWAVTIAGQVHRVELVEVVPAHFTLLVDGASHTLSVRDHAGPWTLLLDGLPFVAETARTRRGAEPGAAAAGRSLEVRSPMPGLLVAVEVDEGARVVIGQPLAIIEAMKMQMEIRAPHAGVVRRVHAAPGQELAAGQVLVTLE
ncbi:MAG TPA: biotin/lipoyl-containing protein [bacterium]|nr:biotin/lipoyl-containing protein [bacterium]